MRCSRRARLQIGLVTVVGAFAALIAGSGVTESTTPLQVAYAGSMGSLMDGGVRPAIAKALGAELQGRAQGSTGLANLIVAGSIRPDVFISVTPEPMRIVLKAGKAQSALPIARTEMVIAYSPHTQYAAALAKAGASGAKPWWQILETPGFRFGRTDPNTDPQGLNVIFVMQLAERCYHQPGLADKILGPQINPQQIFQEQYGLGELFPVCFGILAAGIGVASIVNARLVMRIGMRTLSKWALRSSCVLSFGFMAIAWMLGGHPPLVPFMTYMVICFFCNGLLFSNYNALAMEPMGHIAGVAAAVTGAVSTLVALVMGTLIGRAYDGTVIPLIAGFALLGLAALIVTEWAERNRTAIPSLSKAG